MKMMKLINPDTGLMECKACGSIHIAMLRKGGYYKKGAWQCQYGCKPENLVDKVESKAGQ